MRRLVAAIPLALCGCGEAAQPENAGAMLESAAIERGLIADSSALNVAGAYGRGADRLCAVPDGDGMRLGVDIAYGANIGCTARGRASQSGEDVDVTLDGADGCRFTARFDGTRISFPGRVPEGCAALCDAPASLAGLSLDRLSDAPSEMEAMRTQQGGLLCG